MRFTKPSIFVICFLAVIGAVTALWLCYRWAFLHQSLPVGNWASADGQDTLQFSNRTVAITYIRGGHVAKMSGQAQFIGWNRIMIRNGPSDSGGEGPVSFEVAAAGDELTWTIPNAAGETYKRVKD